MKSKEPKNKPYSLKNDIKKWERQHGKVKYLEHPPVPAWLRR